MLSSNTYSILVLLGYEIGFQDNSRHLQGFDLQ
jgi:hypothetical protein